MVGGYARSVPSLSRRQPTVALLVALLLAVSCASAKVTGGAIKASPIEPITTTSSEAVSSTTALSPPLKAADLAAALKATQEISAGRFEVRRHVQIDPQEVLTNLYRGRFDRASKRRRTELTIAGSVGIVSALAAATNRSFSETSDAKFVTIRAGHVSYVGLTKSTGSPLDIAEPESWVSFDQGPTGDEQQADRFMMLIENAYLSEDPPIEPLAQVLINDKLVDVYRTTVEGSILVEELGNSVLRNLKVDDFFDEITVQIPATVYVENGKVVRLLVDLMPLYTQLVELSSDATARATLKVTKVVTSEFNLIEVAPAGSIVINVPDPATVTPAK